MELDTEIYPIESLKNQFLSFDCFIVAISPEERCIESFKRIMDTVKIKKCILVAFTDLDIKKSSEKKQNWFYSEEESLDQIARNQWQKNHDFITEFLEKNKIPHSIIRKNSLFLMEIIDEVIKKIEMSDTLIFDTSCFPKNYILEILRWAPPKKITCVYTRAIHKIDADHHSIGVKFVTPLPGFEGDIRTRNNFLMVMLGFEGYRSLALLDYNDPQYVLAMIGDPKGDDQKKYITQAKENNRLFLDHQMISQVLVPSIEHPNKIAEGIDREITKFFENSEEINQDDYNIYSSVLGTKVQAIGLFLFWLKNKHIQLIYPYPSKRRIGTGSTGITYIFNITKSDSTDGSF